MRSAAKPSARLSAVEPQAAPFAEQLLKQGYLVIPDAIDTETHRRFYADIDAVFARTPFCQGAFYGETTKRFGRLLIRSDMSARFATHPLILAIAEKISKQALTTVPPKNARATCWCSAIAPASALVAT